MIVQVVHRPNDHALYQPSYRQQPQIHTFDDVNDFSNSEVNFEVTADTYGEIVWGNAHEGDLDDAVFPRSVRPGDDSHRVHTFVNFSLGDSDHKDNYAYVRAASWLDSKRVVHFLVLDGDTQAYLMSDEGKTIRRF